MQQVLAIPETGDVIGGKYRIERALGSGGMGAVFEVSHLITNKHFALKWLLADVNSGQAIGRFIREAKVAGRFQHRNIVEVYDIDKEGNSFYMVMELLHGESLGERLSRGGRLTAGEACRVFLPCLHAIAAVHAAGIVHRDIKPANIFLCAPRGDEPQQPKVLDFGVASFVSALGDDFASTRSGTLIGTPFYMAPEQMRGAPIDRRVDIYALGVTLYEVLSCQRPFQADSYGDLVLKVSRDTPVPLDDLVSDLPKGLSAIVRKAMARDPAERYASIDELITALEPFRDSGNDAGDGVPALLSPLHALAETPLYGETHGGAFRTPSRSAWRRRLALMLAGLGLLLVAAWFATSGAEPEPSGPAHVATVHAEGGPEPPPQASAPPPGPSEPPSTPPSEPPPVQPRPSKGVEVRAQRAPAPSPPAATETLSERPRRKRVRRTQDAEPDERLDSRSAVHERAPATVILHRSEF